MKVNYFILGQAVLQLCAAGLCIAKKQYALAVTQFFFACSSTAMLFIK